MNRTALTDIAPEIFRKRLLVEGHFRIDVDHDTLLRYFEHITTDLSLHVYGQPIIHQTSGQGRAENQGFDGFVPLVDSGIYIAAWVNPKFLSTIIYTCAPFDEDRAVELVRDFFRLGEHQAAVF